MPYKQQTDKLLEIYYLPLSVYGLKRGPSGNLDVDGLYRLLKNVILFIDTIAPRFPEAEQEQLIHKGR